jgi:hypothetical protein
MARHWQRRAWSEGQVATAFASCTRGCSRSVRRRWCALIGRAAADEVRHSGVCTALAGAYRGARSPWRGPAVALPRFVGGARGRGHAAGGRDVLRGRDAGDGVARGEPGGRPHAAGAGGPPRAPRGGGRARARGLGPPGGAGHGGQLAAVERWLLAFVRVGVSEWLAAGEDLPVGTGLADTGCCRRRSTGRRSSAGRARWCCRGSRRSGSTSRRRSAGCRGRDAAHAYGCRRRRCASLPARARSRCAEVRGGRGPVLTGAVRCLYVELALATAGAVDAGAEPGLSPGGGGLS